MDIKNIHRKQKTKIVLFLFIIDILFFSLYIGFSVFKRGNWSNIIAPFVSLVAAGLIFYTNRGWRRSKREWMFLGLACLFWAFADMLWAWIAVGLKKDPESFFVVNAFYFISNVSILVGVILSFIKNNSKWHRIQLTIDSVTILLLSLMILVNVIIPQATLIQEGLSGQWGTLLSLVLHITAAALMWVMYVSAKQKRVGLVGYLILIGILTFSVNSLTYSYAFLRNQYTPNAIHDIFFLLGLLLLGLAAGFQYLLKPPKPFANRKPEAPTNVGRSYKIAGVIVIGFFLVYFGVLEPIMLLRMSVLVAFNILASKHTRILVENEALLLREQEVNLQLEGLVEERTEALRKANQELFDISRRDTLTGLHNRRYLIQMMAEHINKEKTPFSLIYMDLDRFKIINDTHGHSMGDEVIQVIAKRLQKWKKEEMALARLGGDEFVILTHMTENEDLEILCKDIRRLITQNIDIEKYTFQVDVSMGVAKYPYDALEQDPLMRYADIAMYTAKKSTKKEGYSFFSVSQSEKIERHHQLEILLKTAIQREELYLNYQPQVRIRDNKVVGMEALLRWKSKELGAISPMEFIPIAEETGLIIEIGDWVLDRATRQIKDWNSRYGTNLVMGINVSARQLDSLALIPKIYECLEKEGLDPQNLNLEITETSTLNSSVQMEEILTALAGTGVQISIDDFGTGYSSLNYIKRFDIDYIKIAKELIDSITIDTNSVHVVRAIIMMAKGMELTTIAEGVESRSQLEILRGLSCDEVQGYYFSKPLSAHLFEETYLKEKEKHTGER